MDRYVARAVAETGKLGSWGKYELVLVEKDEVRSKTIKDGDPVIEIKFESHPCFRLSGSTVRIRKSRAGWGR